MLDQVMLIAGITVLGVLEKAYFSLQVTYARRKYLVSPPCTSGPPEFERVFRVQSELLLNNSQKYVFLALPLPLLISLRLAPLYFSAKILWVLIRFPTLGILDYVCRFYLGLDLTQRSSTVLCLTEEERGSNEERE
ncbi:leukotriene C4 synthase-like [Salvelinus fontinalis]|uniref:leukotriene C4 synthase-like n=1 Tax=Salvelinus fontinalis TaxID=8038 RepID=UPI002486C42C|nr:leukotriene C4 synthase-like [Salvelinus fontinalis]